MDCDQFDKLLSEGSVVLLGGRAQVGAEGGQGGFGADYQIGSGPGRPAHGVAYGLEVPGDVVVDDDLGQGDPGAGGAACLGEIGGGVQVGALGSGGSVCDQPVCY